MHRPRTWSEPDDPKSNAGVVGAGAVVGAGVGLLSGSVLGAARGRNAAMAVQNRYNIAYTQCMAANGERVATPVSRPLVYAMPPSPVVYLPPPVPMYPAQPPS
jgi:hypothetical protein